MNNIWYPGSAMADEKWIQYLQNTFSGDWIFTDNTDFSNWSNLPGRRDQLNTFNFRDLKREVNTLIISWHPDMKTAEDVIESKILEYISPQKFIYDPGGLIGDIREHLEAENRFTDLGYKLKQIVVLPILYHQYCEFDKI